MTATREHDDRYPRDELHRFREGPTRHNLINWISL